MTLPAVMITDTDRERLMSAAVEALGSQRAAPWASRLLSEISRASVVATGDLSADVVTMHRDIEIRDNLRRTNRRLRLVYPGEDTAAAEAVSVLTPLGVALIGLSTGDSIEWCTPTGDRGDVTVLGTFPY